ncbi:MAG: hypothetical protein ACD_62C00281G0004 [uncultured bacterium]|nr:MAG: hypothetical protein ACD_62C00281G0004 [uncultured bacterium]
MKRLSILKKMIYAFPFLTTLYVALLGHDKWLSVVTETCKRTD